MHSIVTWKRLIPSRFPGRMLSRIFDGKHNEKGKLIVRHSEAVVTVCLYDIFFVLPLAKKTSAEYHFLSLRTLLNCCYSSSCLGFYLRLFVCNFLGGENHWSFSAVVGRIAIFRTEVQTQAMMRKILEFKLVFQHMPFETQNIAGRWGKLYLYLYIYMFMASNIAMSCITCVTLNWDRNA